MSRLDGCEKPFYFRLLWSTGGLCLHLGLQLADCCPSRKAAEDRIRPQGTQLNDPSDDGVDVALPKTATTPAFEALSGLSRRNF